MNIAYTMSETRGGTDMLLFNVAQKLAALGYRTAGTVQVNTDRGSDCKCDMDVSVLPDGPSIRISQDLGSGAKGCRLDLDALESAVGLVNAQILEGADVLIVNKFGKHEAEGRGFRDTIALALERGIPVLVGANRLNEDALVEFTEAFAQRLPSDEDALLDWLELQLSVEKLVA